MKAVTMKKIFALITLVMLICCGCGKTIIDESEVLEKNNKIESLEAENGELKNELAEKELEIARLEDEVASSITYASHIVDLGENDQLLVRSAPTKESKVIGSLKGRELVKVTDEIDDEWVEIVYDKSIGYVMKEYIKPLGSDYS